MHLARGLRVKKVQNCVTKCDKVWRDRDSDSLSRLTGWIYGSKKFLGWGLERHSFNGYSTPLLVLGATAGPLCTMLLYP